MDSSTLFVAFVVVVAAVVEDIEAYIDFDYEMSSSSDTVVAASSSDIVVVVAASSSDTVADAALPSAVGVTSSSCARRS